MTKPDSSSPAPSQSGWWARWVRFLDQREPATALALFRIACALGILGAVGSIVLHGLVPVIWYDAADGGLFNIAENPPWLFRLLGGVTPFLVWAVVITALVSGLLLFLGLLGPIPAFFALQAYLGLSDLNADTS